MRRIIIMTTALAAFLCLSQILFAVPAKPGRHTRIQPDGSTITVTIHGDEWFHYVTDDNGNILEENESGFLIKSSTDLKTMAANMAMARTARTLLLQKEQESETSAMLKARASGSPKIPVFLVQFSDKSFSISNPKTAFTNLLTQSGYSANGGTGSVSDYYRDQSRGAYTPQFVVMDVVTLSGRMSTYGSTDENAAKALYEACQKLDSTVDFSQFDNDGDRKIDMALMYYAGYNEAEGGSTATIWPHQFYVPYVVTNAQSFDGVSLNRYFCTSELKGYTGSNMCGIGTTCHEFAHSIGLPDFYDTNYNNYGDGECSATATYDLMSSGPYNNNGCTPPWMNAEELVMLGWMPGITELTGVGAVTIPSIGSSAPVAYKSSTSASGEYFLYECRPGTGWDSPLAGGLLVYHVDKSPDHRITWKTSSTASATQTAYTLWNNWETYNAVNCNGSHPCFYIIPSGNQTSLTYSGSNFTFPGSSRITAFTPIDWSGNGTGFTLSQIAFNSTSGVVTFNLSNTNQPVISGFVMDSDGNPIQGATITVSATPASAAAPRTGGSRTPSRQIAPARATGAALQTVTTGADGAYVVNLDNGGSYTLEASKSGYVSKSTAVDVSRPTNLNFYLLREGEELPSELFIYPADGELFALGSSEEGVWNYMAANCYPTSMLSAYAGKQIKSISFLINGDADSNGNYTSAGKVYGVLDVGEERKAFIEVESPKVSSWNTVDLSNLEIMITGNSDIYAGYALDGCDYNYPFVCTDPESSDLAGYLAELDPTSSRWSKYEECVFIIKMKVGDYSAPDTGYSFIDDPGKGVYHVGEEFVPELVETSSDRRPGSNGISWFYDDEPVSGAFRLDAAGVHTVSAVFTTASGHRKTIELEIEVR